MLTHLNTLTTSIEAGDHICFLNETETELRTALSHQLSQGLERDEKLLYISHENNFETIQILLKDIGVNANDYLESGQLEIIYWNALNFSEGAFNSTKLIERLRQETNQALTGGFSALRVISELNWTNQSSDDIDLLKEYETSIDEFSHSSPCIFTCLYDMGRCESEVLMDVLRRHPKVALNKEIFENNYYIPPEKSKHGDSKAEELKGWLHNISKHNRLIEEIDFQRDVVSKASAGFVIVTVNDGEVVYANETVENMFGYDRGELIAKPISILNAPTNKQSPEERMQEISDAVQKDDKWSGEVSGIKKDGTPVWSHVKSSWFDHPVHGKTLISIQTDITDRIRANEALIESENRYRDLFNSVPVGLNITNPAGEYIDANIAAMEMFGYPDRETLLGSKTLDEYVNIKDRERWQDIIARHEFIQGYEVQMKKYDGTPIWIRLNIHAVKNVDNQVIYYQSSMEDITDRKRAEESLRKSEKELKDLFETMSEGVVFINPNGQIIFSNEAAHRIMELERSELENRNIARPQRELVHADGTPMQPGDLASSLAMNELRPVNDVVIGIKRQDGSLFWLNSNATPIINKEGKLEGVVSTFTDITRRKQAEDELFLSLEQIKHNQKLLLGLVRASEAIQRTRSSYQQVYKIIGEEIAKFGLQTLIFTLSVDGNYLELQHYNLPDSIVDAAMKLTGLSPLGFRFPLKSGGFYQRLLDAGEVVLTKPGLDPINEMVPEHMRPLSKKLASIVGLDQVIYAPLIVNNQSFGILGVNGHGLSNDDIPAMKTFAAHASIAIENTMLFDDERAAHQQMVDLTNYLQVVREEERTFIAREIHDEFGQRLTALKMDISWLTNHLPTVDAAIVEKVLGMDKLVDESIQLVRQVAADLRPGLLDDLGLTAALEWQTQDFTKRSGIEYDLFLGDTDIPPVQDRDTVLFRVFQEALTNIARHSRATKITVNLIAEHDFIQLKIHDNGIGITSEMLDGTKSLGLLGMRERARSLGGDVEITGIPDQGTTVVVKVPN